MKKRVLWLIGKELVNDSDIPWLIKAGYEIYTLKKAPWKMRAERLCFTEQFDHTLTIDDDMKRELDKLSFCEPVSDEMWEKINRDFSILFIDYYKGQFETALEKFKGTIVLRTLGLPGGVSISSQMYQDHGFRVFREIECIGARFWFAPVYSWSLKKECSIIKRRYVKLPLTVRCPVDERVSAGGKKVLILCPQIKMDSEEEKLYQDAIKLLSEGNKRKNVIPYIVGGSQYLLSDYDANVEGYISEEDFLKQLREASCLLVPQKYMGVVDSYVFQAFSAGVPVVFDRECGLENYWSKHTTVRGAYSTEAEARRLIRQLTRGAKALRKAIICCQDELLEKKLSPEKTRKTFLHGLEHIEEMSSFKTHKVPKVPRVGIILLDKFSAETMQRLWSMLVSVQQGLLEDEEPFALCIGCPIDVAYGYEGHTEVFEKLEQQGIPVRKYSLEVRDQRWLDDMLKMKGYPKIKAEGTFFVLNDRNTYFEDCDLLLFVLNSNSSTSVDIRSIVTTAPYLVYVPDYDTTASFMAKQNRDRLAMSIGLQRKAKAVLVSDPESKKIANSDNGLPVDTVVQIPSLQRPPIDGGHVNVAKMFGADPYFLYFTPFDVADPSYVAAQCLEQYYLRGGKLSAAVIRQGIEGNLWLRFVQQDHYLRQWAGTSKLKKLHEVPEVRLSLTSLSALMKESEFAFLPEQFDLYKTVVLWLVNMNIRTICLDLPSVRGAADLAGGTLHYISACGVDEAVELLLGANGMEKPEASLPQTLFFDLHDDTFYKMLIPGFRMY